MREGDHLGDLGVDGTQYELDRKEIGYEDMDWTHVPADCCEHGNELLSSIKAGNFFICEVTIKFLRKLLQHGIAMNFLCGSLCGENVTVV
jgi:hypothetical protein